MTTVISGFIKAGGKYSATVWGSIAELNAKVASGLTGVTSFTGMAEQQKRDIRTNMYLVSAGIDKLAKSKKIDDPAELKTLKGLQSDINGFTQFTPYVGTLDGFTPLNQLRDPFPNAAGK